MKTSKDPRHQHRVSLFKQLFSFSFRVNLDDQPDSEIHPIVAVVDKIDAYIQEMAPEWPVARLNKVDLAILRLAIFELVFDKKNPPKVIIDEAVELGKEYGSESTAKFVNGVLGGLLNKLEKDAGTPVSTETSSA